jgi:hypothetical protein
MNNKHLLKYAASIGSGLFLAVFGIIATVMLKQTYSGETVIKWIIAGILFGIFAYYFLHRRD